MTLLREQSFSFQTCAAGVFLLCLSGCNSSKVESAAAPPAPPPTPVSVAVAREASIPFEITAVGTAEPSSVIQVRTRVSGELTRVAMTEGGEIHEGDLLFVIDPRPFREAIRQAEASIARDNAQLKAAEANLLRDQAQLKSVQADADRYDQLSKEGVISRSQRDTARSASDALLASIEGDRAAIESAKANIESDRLSVDRAKLELSYTEVRSPVTGRAGNLLVHQGNMVSANSQTPLVVIHQVQPMWVSFGVPEEHLQTIRKLSAQQLPVRATFQDDPSRSVIGKLSVVDNTVDATTGTIRLKATFPNEARLLFPGQFVNITLTLGNSGKAVVVPAEAVQPGQNNGQMIYVVKPDQTAEPRNVTLGREHDKSVIVTKGVAAGETVVTDGQLLLYPGAHVKVVPAEKVDSQKL